MFIGLRAIFGDFMTFLPHSDIESAMIWHRMCIFRHCRSFELRVHNEVQPLLKLAMYGKHANVTKCYTQTVNWLEKKLGTAIYAGMSD